MKKDIHPKYTEEANITCACGTVFVVGSTKPEIKTELCSACHPFYTGKQKLVDTARRVEKFQARTAKKATDIKSKKAKRAKKDQVKSDKGVSVKKLLKKNANTNSGK